MSCGGHRAGVPGALLPGPKLICLGVLILLSVGRAASALPEILVLDMRYTNNLSAAQRYDHRHVAVCLQGLANRDAPRVFLMFDNQDPTWLARLREPGGLCDGWSVRYLSDIYQLFDKSNICDRFKGVVAYSPHADTGVISTSLVATTAAGVEGGIAVRKDLSTGSMYRWLVSDASGPQLPVLIDLTDKFTGEGTVWQTDTPSTGSAKCDAYIWAVERYIDSGACDPTLLMYTLDLWGLKLGLNRTTQLENLDYAISRKGFCFELSPWGDEAPNDDPTQPLGTDLSTFKRILDACNLRNGFNRMIKFAGFPNWAYKYTDYVGGGHRDVETEWEAAKLLTAYNAYIEGDALALSYVSNTSFYAGLLPAVRDRRYVQNPPPTKHDLIAEGLIHPDGGVVPGNYIQIVMGDYDQASWTLYWLAGERYQDWARGQVDCNWNLTPNSVDRVSVALDYMYRHKSERDFFIAGDCGCGYVNPTGLFGSRSPSGYPSIVPAWQAHCRGYYRLFDYSITGWLLNGDSGTMDTDVVDIYAPFSGDGIGMGMACSFDCVLHQNVPALRRFPYDWFGPFNPGAMIDRSSGVHFAWYRSVLRYPSEVKSLVERWSDSGHNHRFLDAFTFYYLLRYHLGGENAHRATWVTDDIPRILSAGQSSSVSVSVRNDGWDTWRSDAGYGLAVAIVPSGESPVAKDYLQGSVHPLGGEGVVAPGETAIFSFDLAAPVACGGFDLYYDMVHESSGQPTLFQAHHNIEWRWPLIVASDAADIDTDRDGVADVIEEATGRLYWYPFDDQDVEADRDNDGVPDVCDNCLDAPNPDQSDGDQDGIGDACDVCPHTPLNDRDGDGVCGDVDNCPTIANAQQTDGDADGVGDKCDSCPSTLPGLAVGPDGCPPLVRGDMSRDGDVDQGDYGLFQRCFSGSGIDQDDPSCELALLDDDADVDHHDVSIFMRCMSGSQVPADVSCATQE